MSSSATADPLLENQSAVSRVEEEDGEEAESQSGESARKENLNWPRANDIRRAPTDPPKVPEQHEDPSWGNLHGERRLSSEHGTNDVLQALSSPYLK